jgi:hypothetical protein
MFTNTQVFEPSMPYAHQRTLILKANGGKVVVEALLDKATSLWVKTDEKNSDGGYVLSCGNAMIRITPSGGAQYDLV